MTTTACLYGTAKATQPHESTAKMVNMYEELILKAAESKRQANAALQELVLDLQAHLGPGPPHGAKQPNE